MCDIEDQVCKDINYSNNLPVVGAKVSSNSSPFFEFKFEQAVLALDFLVVALPS